MLAGGKIVASFRFPLQKNLGSGEEWAKLCGFKGKLLYITLISLLLICFRNCIELFFLFVLQLLVDYCHESLITVNVARIFLK